MLFNFHILINKFRCISTLHSIECGDEEFECDDGKCIDNTMLCDEVRDCESGEDEDPKNCVNTTTVDLDLLDLDTTTAPEIEIESTTGACKWLNTSVKTKHLAKHDASSPLGISNHFDIFIVCFVCLVHFSISFLFLFALTFHIR